MKAERQRLARLQRLERVRAIAKQVAAAEAARAEGTLAQLEALADRTRRLAADYAARTGAGDGAELRQLVRFAGGLQGISATTTSDAARARIAADDKAVALAAAERSRSAVEQRAERQARAIEAMRQAPVLGSRKGLGTDLE